MNEFQCTAKSLSETNKYEQQISVSACFILNFVVLIFIYYFTQSRWVDSAPYLVLSLSVISLAHFTHTRRELALRRQVLGGCAAHTYTHAHKQARAHAHTQAQQYGCYQLKQKAPFACASVVVAAAETAQWELEA